MKKWMSFIFFTLSLNLWAQDCEKVFTSCLKEITPLETAQRFLSLEQMLGEKEELRYLKLFKGFEIVKNETFNPFTFSDASFLSLNELGQWATQKIGVQDQPDYDGFDMLRSAKRMKAEEFKRFL
jgi:hypothetical protein